jgi:hypothetical protein
VDNAIYFWTHLDKKKATTCFWKLDKVFDTQSFNAAKENFSPANLDLANLNAKVGKNGEPIKCCPAGPLGLI